jgi:hypothetical protein
VNTGAETWLLALAWKRTVNKAPGASTANLETPGEIYANLSISRVAFMRYPDAVLRSIEVIFAMKSLLLAVASISFVAGAVAFVPVAFAQNSPGIPGGILQDQFRLQEHPQLQFPASAPSDKYQNRVSKARKRGDNGDPDGCNLQCPPDAE